MKPFLTMASLLRVLLIEHIDVDLTPLMRELQRGGYDVDFHRVESRASMEKALLHQVWDIVICTDRLPHFAVLEALGTLKASGHVLPFFLMVGTTGNDTAVAAFHLAGQDYIAGDGPEPLLPALARELQEQQRRRSPNSLPSVFGLSASSSTE